MCIYWAAKIHSQSLDSQLQPLGSRTVCKCWRNSITIIKSTKHALLKKATNPTATPTLSSLKLTSKARKQAEENWIEEAEADAEDIFVHSSWHSEDRQHGCCSELLTKKLGERRMPSIRTYSAVVFVWLLQHTGFSSLSQEGSPPAKRHMWNAKNLTEHLGVQVFLFRCISGFQH